MNSLFELAGRRALVTGGTRGLGHAMAEGLLESGCKVVIFGTGSRVYDVAGEFRSRGFDCEGIVCDLSDREARVTAFHQAVEHLGGLDILVNAAGITARHKSEEFPMEDWDKVLEVNLTASFALSQLAANVMLPQGHGKIINVASMLSFFGGYTVPAYAASKGGVAQMTKALCNEWAGRGLNVNAIAPGYMSTDINTSLQDPNNPRYASITGRIPAGRWGTGDDLKGVCLFLASAASDYVNGAVIPVDGGYLSW